MGFRSAVELRCVLVLWGPPFLAASCVFILAVRAVVEGECGGLFFVLIVRACEADRARLESCWVVDTPLRADIEVAVTVGVACLPVRKYSGHGCCCHQLRGCEVVFGS